MFLVKFPFVVAFLFGVLDADLFGFFVGNVSAHLGDLFLFELSYYDVVVVVFVVIIGIDQSRCDKCQNPTNINELHDDGE